MKKSKKNRKKNYTQERTLQTVPPSVLLIEKREKTTAIYFLLFIAFLVVCKVANRKNKTKDG
jgi:hypothetical protein